MFLTNLVDLSGIVQLFWSVMLNNHFNSWLCCEYFFDIAKKAKLIQHYVEDRAKYRKFSVI